MTDNFSQYQRMRNDGSSAQDVYLTARANGCDWPTCLRLLRSVFDLDFIQAKEITVVANQLGTSLSEYQGKFVDALEQVLNEGFSSEDSELPT